MFEKSAINFAQLRSILAELGYTKDESRSATKHVTFAHSGHGVAIFLPAYQDRNKVHKMNVAAVRGAIKYSLPDQALEKFDRLVFEATAAKSKRAAAT